MNAGRTSWAVRPVLKRKEFVVMVVVRAVVLDIYQTYMTKPLHRHSLRCDPHIFLGGHGAIAKSHMFG